MPFVLLSLSIQEVRAQLLSVHSISVCLAKSRGKSFGSCFSSSRPLSCLFALLSWHRAERGLERWDPARPHLNRCRSVLLIWLGMGLANPWSQVRTHYHSMGFGSELWIDQSNGTTPILGLWLTRPLSKLNSIEPLPKSRDFHIVMSNRRMRKKDKEASPRKQNQNQRIDAIERCFSQSL